MKKNLFFLGFMILGICGVHALNYWQQQGISGKLVPKDAAEKVVAIQGTDSIKVTPVDGNFYLNVQPGQYQVVVDAKQGYSDLVLEKVQVEMGKTTNLGEIKVEKSLP